MSNNLKNELQRVFDMLKDFEERARKLTNQNLADIAASARGRVQQLCEHPDINLVDADEKDRAEAIEARKNSGGTTQIDQRPETAPAQNGPVRQAEPFPGAASDAVPEALSRA